MEIKLLGIIGIFLAILGIVLSFDIFTHFTVIFVLGWLFIMAYINERYFRNSSFNNLRNSKFLLLLIIIGAIAALLIEFIALFISQSWFYSYSFFNLKFDFWFAIAAYIAFIPATFETYTFLSNLTRLRIKKAFNPDTLFIIILIMSLLLMSMPIVWINPSYKGSPFIFYTLGLFLFSDFLSYNLSKNSVITSSLFSLKHSGVIVLTSFIMAIPIEYMNTLQYVWTYINVPFLDLAIFNLPIIVILGWIPLVSIWINAYKITLYLSKRH